MDHWTISRCTFFPYRIASSIVPSAPERVVVVDLHEERPGQTAEHRHEHEDRDFPRLERHVLS